MSSIGPSFNLYADGSSSLGTTKYVTEDTEESLLLIEVTIKGRMVRKFVHIN